MATYILSAFSDEAAKSLDGQIAALHHNGIRFMETRFIDDKPVYLMEPYELDAMRRKLDENGIAVSSVATFIGKKPITSVFEESMEEMKKAVRAAHILGARYIRLFSFYVEPSEYELYRDEVMMRMEKLTEYALLHDVIPCHENESGIYGQDPAQVGDLYRSVPGLGGIFDAANYLAHGDDVIDGLLETMPALEYLHIKDAFAGEDRVIVPVGEGDGRYAEVLAMTDAAVDGPVFLTLEPHLMEFGGYASIDKLALKGAHVYASPDEAFDAAADALRTLLSNMGYIEGEYRTWIRK